MSARHFFYMMPLALVLTVAFGQFHGAALVLILTVVFGLLTWNEYLTEEMHAKYRAQDRWARKERG